MSRPAQRPLEQTRLMRAVKALPFAGRSYVRACYIGGISGIIRRDASKANSMANELYRFATVHRNLGRISTLLAGGNALASMITETPQSPIHLGLGLLCATVASADYAVGHTQRRAADDLDARIDESGLRVEPHSTEDEPQSALSRLREVITNEVGFPKGNTSDEHIQAAKACYSPTGLELGVTSLRRYSAWAGSLAICSVPVIEGIQLF